MPEYKIEGKIVIDQGHLPYPKPIHISKEGKIVNLAEELKGWDQKKVTITVTETVP